MRINSINQQTQNKQNFGDLRIKGGKKGVKEVTNLLTDVLQDDVESARMVVGTFKKVNAEQLGNSLLDVKISKAQPEEVDAFDDAEYLKAEVVNKKGRKFNRSFSQRFDFSEEDSNIEERAWAKENGKNIVNWLEQVNSFATNKAKVIESITDGINSIV